MTALLSESAFDSARQFLETQARPLEAARFRFHFEEAPSDDVLDELEPYQNADGGFGHGLEPDFRLPKSSVLCTSIAFQILREMGGCPELDLTERAIVYCMATLNQDHHTWRIIPKHTDETIPHAPWWNQPTAANADDADNSFSLNPSAEMLGYLYSYQRLISDDFMSPVANQVLQQLSEMDTIDMHDLLCCLRLFNSTHVPSDVSDRLQHHLNRLIPNAVDTNPDSWSGYGLRPLQIIDGPDSPFMGGLEEAVVANLDYAIASQNENGSWSPSWSWGDQFPEAWAIAQQDWAGILTLDTLLTLQRFDRLEHLYESS
ncbi:MAG: hypothetical protein AAFQ57_02195 [Cyanobacteria bacterium J06626_14]